MLSFRHGEFFSMPFFCRLTDNLTKGAGALSDTTKQAVRFFQTPASRRDWRRIIFPSAKELPCSMKTGKSCATSSLSLFLTAAGRRPCRDWRSLWAFPTEKVCSATGQNRRFSGSFPGQCQECRPIWKGFCLKAAGREQNFFCKAIFPDMTDMTAAMTAKYRCSSRD